MKILAAVSVLILLVALATIEYLHHSMDHHAHAGAKPTTPETKAEAARELYKQHMRSHQ